MSKHKDDIERYLKGELSPSEMHRLEMQALHDPFLAEALEGAELIEPDQFANDVSSINEKISSRNTKKYYWPLRIAASILLIISVTYLVIRNSPKSENDQLALQKNALESGDSLLAKENLEEESKTIVGSDSNQETKPSEENLLSLKSEEKPKSKSAVNPEDTKKQSQPLKAVKSPPQELLSAAEVITEDKEVVAEKMDRVELAQTNEAEKIAELKTETRRTRSESLKKSAAPSTSGAGSDSEKAQINAPTAQPSIGHDEYLKYLKASVKYPKAAIDNKIRGQVVVSFIVNGDSTLSDFKIDKSLGFGCDEELIRLIQSGPQWTPAFKDGLPTKTRVAQSFVFDFQN